MESWLVEFVTISPFMTLFYSAIDSHIFIPLGGGIVSAFFYVIVSLMLSLLFVDKLSAPYSCYLDGELFLLTSALPCYDLSFFRNLLSLSHLLWFWGFLLINSTFFHLFFPLGLSLALPFHIAFWLSLCAFGLFISPFFSWGFSLLAPFFDAGLRTSLFFYHSLSSRFASREHLRTGNYAKLFLSWVQDLFSLTSFLRGFFPLMNWLYQISYLGSRLWLVFILHSFCISCFGELFSLATDQFLLFSFPFAGFLGFGSFLSLLMIAYLFLQVYVYISFSVTFLFSTVIAFWCADYPSHLDPAALSFYLLPVSLVDFAPSHIFLFIFLLLTSSFLFSRFRLCSLPNPSRSSSIAGCSTSCKSAFIRTGAPSRSSGASRCFSTRASQSHVGCQPVYVVTDVIYIEGFVEHSLQHVTSRVNNRYVRQAYSSWLWEFGLDYRGFNLPDDNPMQIHIDDSEVVASTEEDSLLYLESIENIGWGVPRMSPKPNYITVYTVSMLSYEEERFDFYLVQPIRIHEDI